MARVGWHEFDALQNWRAGLMAQMGITSTQKKRYTTSGIRAEYKQRLDALRQRNVAWSAQFNNRQEDFWDQLFPAMREAVNDDGFMRRQSGRIPILNELRTWVDNMGALYAAYEDAKDNTGSENDNTFAKEAMLEWHYQFINQASPEFQEFSSRWLTLPEEPDRTTKLVNDLMGVG